jgi:hypothetical protein
MEAALERASRDKRSLEVELERLGREGPQGIVQVLLSIEFLPTANISLCVQRLQTEITQLMRQLMDISQERDDAVAARDAASLELRYISPA